MGKFAAILAYTLLVTMFLTMAGPAYAQDKPSKEITFTLSGTYTIEEIFDLIHSQTRIYVNREHSIVDLKKKLTVHFRNTPIREVMDKVLGDYPVDWMFSSGDIILFESKNPERRKEDEPITVRGTIVDKEGNPLPGATVIVRGEKKGDVSDGNGRFKIERVPPKSTLIVNSIGFLSKQYRLDGERNVPLVLERAVSQIDPVEVTGNTGYQVLKKKQTPGAVSVIDSTLINRISSVGILDRLEGYTTGLLSFRNPGILRWISRVPDGADIGIYLRGYNTLSPNRVNPNPLIVLDNFPYEGDIKNINPIDISSITFLKDAAAAGIWGARSGNGVIVLTTKRGNYNEKLKVDFNINFGLKARPELAHDPGYLDSKNYLELEKSMFDNGFFDSDLSNRTTFTPITPAVEIWNKVRDGELSRVEGDLLIDELEKNDVRADFSKYSYRNAVTQQYSIGVRGGTKDFAYYISLGHDKEQKNIVNNFHKRTNLLSSNIFKPIKKLEISTLISYCQQDINEGNAVLFRSVQSRYGRFRELYPYASFFNKDGSTSSIALDYSRSFIDSVEDRGFLNWKYNPIEETDNSDRNISIQNLILRVTANYQIYKGFKAEVTYQNQRQLLFSKYFFSKGSYFSRDLVNAFSQYNPINGTINYNLPAGGIMINGEYDWRVNNIRGNLSYEGSKNYHKYRLAIGSEIREIYAEGNERASLGYESKSGVPVTNFNPNAKYSINPTGEARIIDKLDVNGFPSGILNRYLSYYTILNYSYKSKYDLILTGRKDGANIFGAKPNRKLLPFWSAGVSWSIVKEEFFNVQKINDFKFRMSYGINGNIYNGNAYMTIKSLPETDPFTGLPSNSIESPANDNLSWERSKMWNFGLDYSILSNRLSGSVDYFQKKNDNLVQSVNMAPQTGFISTMRNSASTSSRGIEISIIANNKFGEIHWISRLNYSHLKEKLVSVETESKQQSIILLNAFNSIVRIPGKPLKAMYSYKWAGLDSKNGDPQGYLNGEISKDYRAIRNASNTENLIYHGSGIPTSYGSFYNDIQYKGVGISFNVIYRLGYYFRRPGVSLSQAEVLKFPHKDYSNRWQVPGDELRTNVPSITYPILDQKNQFYQRAEVLVESADNIRLQDVRLSYVIKRKQKKDIFNQIEFYSYLSNLGIIWKASKLNLDPDVNYTSVLEAFPIPVSISLGAILKL